MIRNDTALSPLARQVTELEHAERRRALCAMLRQPLLTAGGTPTQWALVRKHAAWLREWFTRYPGWRLRIDSETARLDKTPAGLTDGTRPARDPKSGQPFDRRRYVLVCLALASLERSDRQTTLGDVAQRVVALVQADEGLATAQVRFTLQTRDERRDMVAAMRLLMSWNVLRRLDGDEEAFVRDEGDVLYNVNRSALTAVLNVQAGPSMVTAEQHEERLAAITRELVADCDDARNQHRQHRLIRRLLDDPVVYYDDLPANEREYLNFQRSRLLDVVCEATGLTAEVRAEGIAMVDQGSDFTDLAMPEEGTDGQVTLLIAEFLAMRVRNGIREPVETGVLERHVAQVRDDDPRSQCWRKEARQAGTERALVRQSLERLAGLGLVQRTSQWVIPRPALARFAMEEPTVQLAESDMR
jgi:uncharacterized protein (TIGR02678 family)